MFDNRDWAFIISRMLELEQAREKILAAIKPLGAEIVPVGAAVGRVVAQQILSPINLPVFDNSAMDGYAVRADDLKEARANAPVALELWGQVPAGEVWQDQVRPGACVRIFTGSPLPAGTDAVVMQEDTRTITEKPDQVFFLEPVKPWENVRLSGEDVKRGEPLCAAGERVTVGCAGLLAAAGVEEIKVGRQPTIGLLATGSELVEPGQALAPGRIYESNRVTLTALMKDAGTAPRVFPLVPDELTATRTALEQAFAQCDCVVTSGGASVGELDLVKKAFTALGGAIELWKVAVKPGRPFVFGRWQEKFLFGLPGNPVSALVTFLLLVRPALLRWQGATQVGLLTHPGTLTEPLVNRGERRHFMRVHVDETGRVRSAGIQASHILSSMAKANGLVDVPAQTTLPANTVVPVIRW